MTKANLSLVSAGIAVLAFFPATLKSQIYLTSTLTLNGTTATATCSGTARAPQAPNTVSPVASNRGYLNGLSEVCTVTDDGPLDSGVISRSLDQDADFCYYFPNFSNPYPFGPWDSWETQYNSSDYCSWTFRVVPGEHYTLTTKHYLYLENQGFGVPDEYGDGLSCAFNGYGNATSQWDDPLGYYSGPNGTNFPSQGSTETVVVNPSGVPGCVNEGNMVNDDPATGAASSFYGILLGTTHATIQSISVGNTPTSFYQGQEYAFQSNLQSLITASGINTDNINWCIQTSPGNCGGTMGIGGFPQGLFDGPTEPTTVQDGGNSQLYVAPPNVSGSLSFGQTKSSQAVECVCVQETLNTNNFACATVNLTELYLNLYPGPSAP